MLSLLALYVVSTDLAPAMTPAERTAYRKLVSEAERESFRKAFWKDKRITESEYLNRAAHADQIYGSGREGSGANTDQGRMYIASGPPNKVVRMPSSRVFVACEIWQYETLPGSGYKSQLQFLFFRKAMGGDFRLFWPGLHSVRDLLIPQPGTRSMFGVNDVITPNDIRARLGYSPTEEEIVEAATGVARGITGSGNSEILARVMSPGSMYRFDKFDGVRGAASSTFIAENAPEVRVVQFWSGEVPVVDVQVRTKAAGAIALAVDASGARVEQSSIPLGFDRVKPVLYMQRFFLAPGAYTLLVDVDGRKSTIPLRVSASREVLGEGFEDLPGEVKIALLPDPRSEDAKASAQRIPARQ
jgi:GWxTD domain-containing protein